MATELRNFTPRANAPAPLTMLTDKSLSKEEIAYYRAPFSTAFCLKLKLTNARVRKYNIGILIGYKNPRSSMYRIFFPNKIPLLNVQN